MKQQLHITVSGGLEGEFVVTEEHPGGKFVIERDTSWGAMLKRSGERDLTPAEWQEFMDEHGSEMLPPDGEG